LKERKINCSDIPSLTLPEGWSCIKTEGAGPFVTKAILRHPAGSRVHWSSRDHRKHHNLIDSGSKSTWHAPGAIGWWIGVLFAIGASCFAVGAIPGYTNLVGFPKDALTFFMGSLFFTTAAFLQYIETINARQTPKGSLLKEKIRFLTWEPRRIDWLSSVVQLIGTIFFNVSTFYSINFSMSAQTMDHLVWGPDAYGSICFLIASLLVWIEVGHSLLSWNTKSLSWQIAFLNLLGSIAFGFSAVAAFIIPATGQPINLTLVNMGTFTGGICFLIGGVLLLPERTHPDTPVSYRNNTNKLLKKIEIIKKD
jgi:hypothetical protein